MKIGRIYLDMDGVLADWIRGVAMLFTTNPDALMANWDHEAGSDICPQLGISMDMLWQRIDCAGEAFWSGLPAFPWTHYLWQSCQDIARTTVLSSPSWHPSSLAGKLQWLDKHFGGPVAFRRYLIGPEKRAVAAPGRVLIDDREKMCLEWEEEGGKAILFPGPGNRRREEFFSDRNGPGDIVLSELEALRDAG